MKLDNGILYNLVDSHEDFSVECGFELDGYDYWGKRTATQRGLFIAPILAKPFSGSLPFYTSPEGRPNHGVLWGIWIVEEGEVFDEEPQALLTDFPGSFEHVYPDVRAKLDLDIATFANHFSSDDRVYIDSTHRSLVLTHAARLLLSCTEKEHLSAATNFLELSCKRLDVDYPHWFVIRFFDLWTNTRAHSIYVANILYGNE